MKFLEFLGTTWHLPQSGRCTVPPDPQGLSSMTPSGGLTLRGAPNPNPLLQLCQKCGGSFFIGRCSLFSDFSLFQAKHAPVSV